MIFKRFYRDTLQNLFRNTCIPRRLTKARSDTTIELEQEFEKSALDICKIKKEQAEKQKMPKYTIKSTNKEPIEELIAEVVMDDLETTANEHVVNDDDRPAFNLLKGTCTSSIELEYNMEECFKALTDRLDWNNPEGDCCPFDLTKPLPLKGRSGCLTVAAE
ncbi:hypothetical protein Tco_0710516 [Tanacetum coccineum]